MDSIALFGGSFDPPHIGHEAIVKALMKLDKIDKIIIMPTYLNPFKTEFFAPADLRVKWLKQIFFDYKKVEISEFEVSQNRSVATIDTIRYLKKNHGDIYLVIGADNLASFSQWSEHEELVKMVKLIVASRNGATVDGDFMTLEVKEDTSSSALRNEMQISKLPTQCADEIYNFFKDKTKCKTE